MRSDDLKCNTKGQRKFHKIKYSIRVKKFQTHSSQHLIDAFRGCFNGPVPFDRSCDFSGISHTLQYHFTAGHYTHIINIVFPETLRE